MEKRSCLIADDVELDRLSTLSYVRRLEFLRVDGVFSSSAQLLESMGRNSPFAIFLDIDMPGMTGLELREQLMHIPVCIFITAYPEYAVESFEREAFDFLIKPIRPDRFARTAERLEQYIALHDKADVADVLAGKDLITIREGHEQHRIRAHDVLYLEALKDYTRIVTRGRKYCVLSSIGNLIRQEAFQSFVRIHKSFAIRPEYMQSLSSNEVRVDDMWLPLGRRFKDEALKRFASVQISRDQKGNQN